MVVEKAIRALLVLSLAACTRLGPPPEDGVLRVDGRTHESFEASLRRIKNSLSDAEQSRFCNSAMRLHAPLAKEAFESGGGYPAIERSMRECMHGMSVEEIHAAAARTPQVR